MLGPNYPVNSIPQRVTDTLPQQRLGKLTVS